MRPLRARIGASAFSLVAMLGLVAAPASAEPVQPAPEAVQLAPEPNPYDIIRSYVVKTYTDTYLRRGTSTWGYTHLVARGRWCSWTDSKIRNTLLYWSYNTLSGTSRTYHYNATSFGILLHWRVVVEYGSGNKGVITAYNLENRYFC
jgi:hypothetical protein